MHHGFTHEHHPGSAQPTELAGLDQIRTELIAGRMNPNTRPYELVRVGIVRSIVRWGAPVMHTPPPAITTSRSASPFFSTGSATDWTDHTPTSLRRGPDLVLARRTMHDSLLLILIVPKGEHGGGGRCRNRLTVCYWSDVDGRSEVL